MTDLNGEVQRDLVYPENKVMPLTGKVCGLQLSPHLTDSVSRSYETVSLTHRLFLHNGRRVIPAY